MDRRNILKKSAVAIGATIGVAGCSGSEDNNNSDTNDGPLVIQQHGGQTGEYGNVSVVGLAENVSDRVISYAQIQVYFYNDGDARLGSGLANISNLSPGASWEFKAMYLGTDADRVGGYRIGEVSP